MLGSWVTPPLKFPQTLPFLFPSEGNVCPPKVKGNKARMFVGSGLNFCPYKGKQKAGAYGRKEVLLMQDSNINTKTGGHYIYRRYVYRNGRRIYPVNAKAFRIWVAD